MSSINLTSMLTMALDASASATTAIRSILVAWRERNPAATECPSIRAASEELAGKGSYAEALSATGHAYSDVTLKASKATLDTLWSRVRTEAGLVPTRKAAKAAKAAKTSEGEGAQDGETLEQVCARAARAVADALAHGATWEDIQERVLGIQSEAEAEAEAAAA